MSKFNSGRVSGTRGLRNGPETPNIPNNHSDGAGSNALPDRPSILKHIFRDDEGHLTDTPAHRAELLSVANDASCYLGDDQWGNHWFSRTNSDGTQTWAIARNGTIFEGGRNSTPRSYNEITGLNAKAPQKKGKK